MGTAVDLAEMMMIKTEGFHYTLNSFFNLKPGSYYTQDHLIYGRFTRGYIVMPEEYAICLAQFITYTYLSHTILGYSATNLQLIFAATIPTPNFGRRSYCPQVSARGLHWNWTMAGTYAVQPCPGGATGLARWK